ncbi:MAG: hypothetical protein LUJ25_01095 [Firmicutes bacterium]|nr:hypothetical protein [Bacillota bacterium]
MDRNVLKEYLESRKKEVVTMMMDLYDQDRILEIHIESEKKIAAEEAAEKAAEKAAKKAEEEQNAVIERMLRDGSLSIDKIASFIGVPLQRVRKIETQMLQES